MENELKFADFVFDIFPGSFVNEAVRPLEDVRLIVVDAVRQEITHDKFTNITKYFDDQDILVWNNTGISRSRLIGQASSGEEVDICFLLKEDEAKLWDVIVLSEKETPEQGKFELCDGSITGEFKGKTLDFEAPYWVKEGHYNGYRGLVRIDQSDEELRHVLDTRGKYMHPWYTNINELQESQLNPINSVKRGGILLSEPARRFTQDIVGDLRQKGVEFMYVSLAISFSWRTYESEMSLGTYQMNPEEFEIGEEAITILESALRENKRVVCIGTSCVRVLETLPVPPRAMNGRTDIFIQPGFQFKYCDALLTNLHNSMGTHVIMACAIGGKDLVLEAYRQAVAQKYGFGIHGDSMLILGNHSKIGRGAGI